ncbi:MAG TPA: dTDP-4-dehydrorhamnose 3,5-epimerase family protein [Pseudonocardia sp.]|jgi:dTDP-4-dehydrorhamnose 3,5-epimerase|uniref:dTDP-4-dehydrorhamnose 3,5-epimerase family protein n=1 Tax=Pseudonocardia sp. TaxID=60912 RepID=UPI002B4B6E45|nr:dTDP-4-dehydrorhamnose 3,5-epimerase family protein [Pseudonocardia sp.]HLU57627.1 dTDP-4-dehydrorhamnose 3,5-epimerase family protein [Pseudonocardia sp.]
MSELRVEQTSIPGLLYIDLVVHHDGRGWFKESFQRAKLEALGFPPFEVVQSNVSYNAEVGVTRGIHAEPWEKYISLAHGRAFAAIVDLRAGENFGRVETFELHPGNALFVPRGCGNSYQTLTPDVVYSYLVNEHWTPDARYTMVQAFDSALGIEWPIGEDKAIRSDKDRGHPPLSAITPIGAV